MVKREPEAGRERVSIAGAGRIGGGTYHSVKVAGSGTIEGDVKAQTISTAGSCVIKGSVEAEELKTAGSCRVEGDVRAEEFRTTGSATVEGEVQADVFKSSGSQRIGGKLTASYVKTSGSLEVSSDVEADKFVSEGSFEIGGLLTADEISIRLGGDCEAREIGGERIEVRQKSGVRRLRPEDLEEKLERKTKGKRWKFEELGIEIDIDLERLTRELGKLGAALGNLGLNITGFGGYGTLEAETIEGDEIYLESTRAKTVRGKRVTIGPDCEIETVEYEELLEVDESSQVAKREKI
jgi:cytoskeletal protein CcmA (bactofilin family)